MKLTRDSWIWWLVLFAGASTFLTAHFELICQAFPSCSPAWQARIELAAGLATFIAGYLRMSPLALSADHPLASGSVNASQTLTIAGNVPKLHTD